MGDWWREAYPWLVARGPLVAPLLLTMWMAVGDFRTQRIPNYLTLGTALAGLAFQSWTNGWAGLGDGALGLLVGFGLLIPFYAMGGMGAGDVKALAGLGAWLGPKQAFLLFIYMAVSGGVLALMVVWWRGQWRQKLTSWRIALVNRFLTLGTARGPQGDGQPPEPKPQEPGFPYGVALAIGMVVLFIRG